MFLSSKQSILDGGPNFSMDLLDRSRPIYKLFRFGLEAHLIVFAQSHNPSVIL